MVLSLGKGLMKSNFFSPHGGRQMMLPKFGKGKSKTTTPEKLKEFSGSWGGKKGILMTRSLGAQDVI